MSLPTCPHSESAATEKSPWETVQTFIVVPTLPFIFWVTNFGRASESQLPIRSSTCQGPCIPSVLFNFLRQGLST